MKRRHQIVYAFLQWVTAWARLFDGIVGVITLGFVHPELTFKALAYQITYLIDHWQHDKET